MAGRNDGRLGTQGIRVDRSILIAEFAGEAGLSVMGYNMTHKLIDSTMIESLKKHFCLIL